MKNNLKSTVRRVCAVAAFGAFLNFSAAKTFGIEGLKISVQNETNLVLGWPSVTNATYIIQYSPTLNVTNGWQTLTNYYPAFPNTNWTEYTIFGAIPLASGGGSGTNGQGGGGGPPPPGAMVESSTSTSSDTSSPSPELEPGDVIVPPTPWIPETLPGGAILRANGTYTPLPPPPGMSRGRPGGTGGPDGGVSGGGDPGFYLVVQNGVTCVGITNGMALSGTVTIPLEIAVPTNDYINGAILNVDGTEAPGGVAVVGPNNLWTFYWDTTEVPNGTHQLSAQVIFSEGSADIEATNLLTVTVSNLVSFPYYYAAVFGQGVGMWVNAQSAVNDIDWEVLIYDSQTNYLGYFSGTTNNGSISFSWGLQTSPNSPPLMDPTFRLDYYLFSAATGKSLTGGKAAASRLKIGEAPWTPSGMMVACAPIDGNANHTAAINTLVMEGVVDPCFGNMPGGLQPVAFNNPNANAWTWGSDGDGITLLELMHQCNFFYYFGHGSPNSFGIGPNSSVTAPPTNDITAFWINRTLYNFPAANFPTNSHPYKLVFIDGCMSGTGALPEAFGIPSVQYSTNDFMAAGINSRAFVGFKKNVTIAIDQINAYEPALQAFWSGWLGNRSIHEIVTNCQQAFPSYPMPSSAVIYGATDMAKFSK